ncbi:MAG: hypothetical protein AAF497_04320 [Planctomycetota bacterium]
MNLFSRVLTVFEFELRRAMAPTRMAWWCVLAFFPVALVILLLSIPGSRSELPSEVWATFLFAMIPMLVSMLGTFLWTAPAISTELERQSWVYLAIRPHGRVAVLLGKYAAAVAWVLPAAITGATVSVFLLWVFGSQVAESGSVMKTWLTICRLSMLSIPAYAALFLALGTLFTKRAMVICVAYTLIFELVISFVPALMNKLTIQFRLRALYLKWLGIDVSQFSRAAPIDLVGSASASQHVMILIFYTLVMLAIAVTLILQRDYVVTTAADAN